jgi:hypothetical protein
VDAVLGCGADPNLQAIRGTPHMDEDGINVNTPRKAKGGGLYAHGVPRGSTALYVATMYGQNEAIGTLLRSGASILIPNYAGDTPVHAAAGERNPYAMASIIGADGSGPSGLVQVIHAYNRDGFTPYHMALQRCDLAIVRQLLSAGMPISYPSLNRRYATAGACPILMAGQNPYSRAAFYLLVQELVAQGLVCVSADTWRDYVLHQDDPGLLRCDRFKEAVELGLKIKTRADDVLCTVQTTKLFGENNYGGLERLVAEYAGTGYGEWSRGEHE